MPSKVCVAVPVNGPKLRGRYATSYEAGALVSIRMPASAIEAIDAARKIADPTLSRAMFIRIASTSMAKAINAFQGNDEHGSGDDAS